MQIADQAHPDRDLEVVEEAGGEDEVDVAVVGEDLRIPEQPADGIVAQAHVHVGAVPSLEREATRDVLQRMRVLIEEQDLHPRTEVVGVPEELVDLLGRPAAIESTRVLSPRAARSAMRSRSASRSRSLRRRTASAPRVKIVARWIAAASRSGPRK